jgi:diacylglycerol kinase (ATP)
MFAIGIVWIAEAVNTAIEALADRITRENDDAIRRAKDVAAGAVLLAAITAAIIGLLILGPHAWAFVRRGF